MAPLIDSRDSSGERGHPMSIEINKDFMSLEINGAQITAAVRVDHLWRVTGWPGLLTRNEAITALTLAERLAPGRGHKASRSAPWGDPGPGYHWVASRGLGRIPGRLASPRLGSAWEAPSRRSSSRSRRL